jgi:uncharacterized protein YndB with AHSA1/START domain
MLSAPIYVSFVGVTEVLRGSTGMTSESIPHRFGRTVLIEATPALVWEALTQPAQMRQWMGEPEINIEVRTTWEVGGPIQIKGFHHAQFINTGKVLAFVPNELLRYTHTSSVSRLPDVPESYTLMEFRLAPQGEQTSLTITLENFPTESIYKHLAFYWRIAPKLLQEFIKRQR